jgi:hypothetical protein
VVLEEVESRYIALIPDVEQDLLFYHVVEFVRATSAVSSEQSLSHGAVDLF